MTDYVRKGRRSPGSITATDAAKTFGQLVDRVRETRAVYVIERGGTPVAQIGPVARGACTVGELVGALRELRMDAGYLAEVERGIRKANKPAVPVNPWER
jgi:antitoxin (DNA-binding transcriptional repressor) of toxin-antitoxin stability system